MRTWWIVVAGVLALFPMLAACSDPEAGGGRGDGGSAALVSVEPASDGDTEGRPVVVDEILADGHVTAAEYERAVLAHMQCLRENGLEHGTPVWNEEAGFVPRWNYEVRVPALAPGQEDPSETCFFEYEAEVQSQWMRQHEPSEVEQQRREQVVADCVAELGHDVGDYAAAERILNTGPQILTDMEYLAVVQCFGWGLHGTPRMVPDEE